MKYLIALVGLALVACDGAIIEAVEGGERACPVPRVGDTCPYRPHGLVEIEQLVESGTHCVEPESVIEREIWPGNIVEHACQPPAGEPVTYRYVVGSYAREWGFSYQTARGTLIHCDPDGIVQGVYPLANYGTPEEPRYLRLLVPDDWVCVDDGRCEIMSEECWL